MLVNAFETIYLPEILKGLILSTSNSVRDTSKEILNIYIEINKEKQPELLE